MLVLSRKVGEEIIVGDDITITVVAIPKTDRVRIGVTAPREVPVHRREVYDAIVAEQSGEPTIGEAQQRGGEPIESGRNP